MTSPSDKRTRETDQQRKPSSLRHGRSVDEVDEPRPVTGSSVGWRYGSALAAARALNARPVSA